MNIKIDPDGFFFSTFSSFLSPLARLQLYPGAIISVVVVMEETVAERVGRRPVSEAGG